MLKNKMKYILIIILTILIGCSPAFFQPINVGTEYKNSILEWQERIKKEGWTENLINNIINRCIHFAYYEAEEIYIDYWKLPKEFIKDGFKGDCEDIGFFIWGTLKKLKYPYEIRGVAIRMPMGDHFMLKIKLPNNQWKMYNPVPIPGDFIDLIMSRKIVEFNETEIFY